MGPSKTMAPGRYPQIVAVHGWLFPKIWSISGTHEIYKKNGQHSHVTLGFDPFPWQNLRHFARVNQGPRRWQSGTDRGFMCRSGKRCQGCQAQDKPPRQERDDNHLQKILWWHTVHTGFGGFFIGLYHFRCENPMFISLYHTLSLDSLINTCLICKD